MNKVSGLCITVIRLYQRHISPHKGFSCAHRVLCGTVSCSAYALEQFQNKKPLEAYKLTRSRMRECSAVYRKHMSAKSKAEQKAAKGRRRMRYLKLIDPRTYISIVRNYLINKWPKKEI